jgi:hypothetical protein
MEDMTIRQAALQALFEKHAIEAYTALLLFWEAHRQFRNFLTAGAPPLRELTWL